MGVYIDSLRAKKIRATLHGREVDIHALEFLCKPLYAFMGDLVRSQKMAIARTEKYWESRELPRYVTFIHEEFQPESPVIEWKGGCVYWDCDKTPGKTVGTLKLVADNSRKGFHWEVESNMLELNPT
jgi:hypothetical protein